MSTAKSGKLITNNNSSPLVTIIIPVYNGSNFLAEAIDSALAQTYKNFEIIVVNDGSTDNGKTENVAMSYGSKIRYYYKTNGGVSSALNFGIKKAKGDWISWLSHDDVYLPNKLDDQLDFIRNNPQSTFVYSDYCNSDELQNGRNKIHQWKIKPAIPTPLQLLESSQIHGCTTLIHKSCFSRAGYFNENNKTAQDNEMWLSLSFYYDLYHCPKTVLTRRVHSQMGSKLETKQNIKDHILIFEKFDLVITDYLSKLSKYSRYEISKFHLYIGDIYLRRNFKLYRKHYSIAKQMDRSLTIPILLRQLLKSNYFIGLNIHKLFWKIIKFKNSYITLE